MNEIEFLTEKDIPYFENLAKEGKAVIVRIDPEKLLRLDLDQIEPNTQWTLPELHEWLQEHQAEMAEKAAEAEAVIKENEEMKQKLAMRESQKSEEKLLAALSSGTLSKEQSDQLIGMIDQNISEDVLAGLIGKGLTPDMLIRIANLMKTQEK